MSNTPPIGQGAPWLAPLAGYSDLPFRMLCRDYGAACAVTEMVSAKGMVYKSPGTKELLATCPEDDPLVVQLFGREPDMFAGAMDMLLEAGFRFFDLNCGCPVPKVVKSGSGAAMLRTPDRLCDVARVMVEKAGPGAVGVKLRVGWADGDEDVYPVAERLEQLGVAWLTLHPRSARQGYSGTADWSHVARLKRLSGLPIIASGDLFSAEDARRCLAVTGADGVMFARGALYDPAVFSHFLRGATPEPSGQEIARIIERHAEYIRRFGRPEKAVLRMRSIVPRYIRGLAGAKALRLEVGSCTSWEHLSEIVGRIALAGPVAAERHQEEDLDGSCEG